MSHAEEKQDVKQDHAVEAPHLFAAIGSLTERGGRVYRIAFKRTLGVPQVGYALARVPGGMVVGVGHAPTKLAAAVGLALAVVGSPAWAQACTPSVTTICGANGGTGGLGNTFGTGLAGTGSILTGPYANSGGAGGGTATSGGAGQGISGSGGHAGVYTFGPVNPASGGGAGGGGNAATQGVGGGGGGGAGATTGRGGGGGGGGGNVGQSVSTGISFDNPGAISGGAGGAGGNGSTNGGGGGGGGVGVFANSGSSITSLAGTAITGGKGGNGGSSGFTGHRGDGGTGGAGVVGNGFALNNGGTISGGAGGTINVAGAGTLGIVGAGGVGVVSTGSSTLINSGTIAGGMSGNATTRTDAVNFSGGANTLEIRAGYAFLGNVVSSSGATNGGDTLTLGGTTVGSFNVSQLGALGSGLQYQGFAKNEKWGTSTWTLTGTGNATQAWKITNGTLAGNTTSLVGNLTFAPVAGGSATVNFNQAINGTYAGVIAGDGALTKIGTGTLVLTGNNTYTGGTALHQGRLNLGHNQALGTGALAMDDDTTLGFSTDGLTIANTIQLTGSNDPVIDTGAFSETLSGAISGGGFITKQGTGTLTLSGANTYTGATDVAQGTLKAGAANTFSAASAHNVASGASLDLAGFNQTVASLTNSGTVSLVGTTPGTTLTVNGAYVGNNGVLKLGTALNGSGPSDRLVLNGATAVASGKTSVQITNLGGLGALTSGNGIEVISAQNGATTTAQTSKDAFSLAGGHIDAGAYEYRLNAGDAKGAGENWYLRSTTNAVSPTGLPVVTYRPEASLYAALPSQLRQGNLAMLGNMRLRVGDDDVKGTATTPTGSDRRAWGRVLSTDIDIRQGGTVSPTSKGRLTGFQAGTDLLSTPNWRAGVYVGQLDGDATVNGFASGVSNLRVGRNDLRSQYVGVYGTYTGDSGFYADAVVQSGRHRYTVEPNPSAGASGKGHSLLASIEVGQAFPLGDSGWAVEPQLQLIHQQLSLGDSTILGAVVQPKADSGWIARAGVRVKGEIDTGMGMLQPYGRLNVYKTSSGTDIARFVNGATTTDILAPTGGTSTELAGGFTLALSQTTSLYGEVGKLWSSGGDAKVKSGINGSLGVRVKW